MRLLNTGSFRLEEFVNERGPEYAILSHTWGDGEIQFQDMQNAKDKKWTFKSGFEKVKATCRRALQDGYNYVWIDTCCIDKSSSAELSESINSMFRWYKSASICYAFLEDVQELADLPASRWFTRGWTLQELIAPENVYFYSREWKRLGDRYTLAPQIAERSGIGINVLTHRHIINGEPWERHVEDANGKCWSCRCYNLSIDDILRNICVAQKMTWTSGRFTTREEDMAYCLLGLFGVNMALIYGEGLESAFRRLQEEILKRSDDQSILMWCSDRPVIRSGSTPVTNERMSGDRPVVKFSPPTAARKPTDLLATHPWQFQLGRYQVQRNLDHRKSLKPDEVTLTARRISLTVLLGSTPADFTTRTTDRVAILNCVMGNDLKTRPALVLEGLTNDGTLFRRHRIDVAYAFEPPGRLLAIVRKKINSKIRYEYVDKGSMNYGEIREKRITIVETVPGSISYFNYSLDVQSRIAQFNQHNMENSRYRIVDSIPRWIDDRARTLPAAQISIVAFEHQCSSFFVIWSHHLGICRIAIVSLQNLFNYLERVSRRPVIARTAMGIMNTLRNQGKSQVIVSGLLETAPGSSLTIDGSDSDQFQVIVRLERASFLDTGVLEVEVDITKVRRGDPPDAENEEAGDQGTDIAAVNIQETETDDEGDQGANIEDSSPDVSEPGESQAISRLSKSGKYLQNKIERAHGHIRDVLRSRNSFSKLEPPGIELIGRRID